MTIKHHISGALLMGYAAGTLPEAFSLVVATHVSLCDACRAELAAYEVVGGAVIEDQATPMSAGALEAVLGRLDALAPPAPSAPVRRGILPGPLAAYVGGDISAVKWRTLGGGVRQAILPTSRAASARLLYIPAGKAVPDHGHRGLELTLVLQGAFRDEDDRFGPGDVETASAAVNHTPIAEAGADCICLAASDAPLRFRAVVPRLLQPIFRI
ncbi:MAG: ChrR family anti-sigma-E factor [Paracoccaceae bacterium]